MEITMGNCSQLLSSIFFFFFLESGININSCNYGYSILSDMVQKKKHSSDQTDY